MCVCYTFLKIITLLSVVQLYCVKYKFTLLHYVKANIVRGGKLELTRFVETISYPGFLRDWWFPIVDPWGVHWPMFIHCCKKDSRSSLSEMFNMRVFLCIKVNLRKLTQDSDYDRILFIVFVLNIFRLCSPI